MSNGDIQKSVPKKAGRWDQNGGDEGFAAFKKKATNGYKCFGGAFWVCLQGPSDDGSSRSRPNRLF
jgi:hypothetical protein